MHSQPLYEFGPYQLDPIEKVLRRDGVPVPLTPKAFETLLALVEKSGRVVEKAELMSRVWPDAFVEEQNLAFNISVLRKTLGTNADGPTYIETVPKRGYRFTANVRRIASGLPAVVTQTHTVTRVVTEEEVEIADAEATELARLPAINLEPADYVFAAPVIADEARLPPRASRTSWRLPLILALSGLLAAVILGAWFWKFRRPAPLTSFKAAPFTTSAGFETDPAISPDGNQIAYAWKKEGESVGHIYVQLVDSSTPLQLTYGAASESDPTWSPDSRRIAFFRAPDIFVISAHGGPERRVGSANNGLMSWSPDGKTLAIIDKPANSRDNSVFLHSVETGDRQQLTFPPATGFDGTPVFSPNGAWVAFNRSFNSGNVNDIFITPTSGGEPRRITNDNRIILGFDWASDRELIFSSDREGPRALWRVALDSGTPVKLDVSARSPGWPTVSQSSGRLAFLDSFTDSNVWRLQLNANAHARTPIKLISSTRYDSSAQYSPDGKRIAFRSDRSGSNEIWLCDSDGTNAVQLTDLRGPLAGSPRWSPDGKYIAFDSRHEGQSRVYVISSDGGRVRRLTEHPPIQVVPRWSADGRWIYFRSNTDAQIWKVPAAGGQAAVVPLNKATGPTESADGKFIYFRRQQEPFGIFRVPTAGGAEETLLPMKEPVPWGYWTVTEKGIYFLVNGERPKIQFFDLGTREISDVWTMEKPALISDGGLAVSPDGQWLLFTQLDSDGSDIMLVNDFR